MQKTMIVQNNRKMTRKKNQGTFRKNFTIFFDFFFFSFAKMAVVKGQ